MNIPVDNIMKTISTAFELVIDILYKIILFPFRLWFSLPSWVHIMMFIVICIILYKLFMFFRKNKDTIDAYV